MNLTTTYRGLLAAFMMAAMMSQPQVQAGCGLGSICCPKCEGSCTLKSEKVDVEKKCFEVESKTICIPRVVFPWQTSKKKSGCSSCDLCDGVGCNSCVHNGATTRTIRVLKTKKYKCPECKYTWSADKPSSCDSGCSETGCASGSCGGCSPCDAGEMSSSMAAPPVLIAPMAPGGNPIEMSYEEMKPQMMPEHSASGHSVPQPAMSQPETLPQPVTSDYYAPAPH